MSVRAPGQERRLIAAHNCAGAERCGMPLRELAWTLSHDPVRDAPLNRADLDWRGAMFSAASVQSLIAPHDERQTFAPSHELTLID